MITTFFGDVDSLSDTRYTHLTKNSPAKNLYDENICHTYILSYVSLHMVENVFPTNLVFRDTMLNCPATLKDSNDQACFWHAFDSINKCHSRKLVHLQFCSFKQWLSLYI